MAEQKVIEVHWFDYTFHDEVYDAEEAMGHDLIEMRDVGYFVGEDKRKIALAGEWAEEQGSYRHLTWIPKVNIISRRYLK